MKNEHETGKDELSTSNWYLTFFLPGGGGELFLLSHMICRVVCGKMLWSHGESWQLLSVGKQSQSNVWICLYVVVSTSLHFPWLVKKKDCQKNASKCVPLLATVLGNDFSGVTSLQVPAPAWILREQGSVPYVVFWLIPLWVPQDCV